MRTTLLLLLLCYLSIGYAQEKAADFTLKNTKDEEVSLSSFSGKVIVLEWFTTWCTKCREAFPELKPFLNKINREYAEKGVVVMAINLDKKEPEKVKAFAEKKGMEYTLLLDPEGITGKSYSLKTLPLLIVICKDGTIAKKFPGYTKGTTIKDLQQTLDALVEKK